MVSVCWCMSGGVWCPDGDAGAVRGGGGDGDGERIGVGSVVSAKLDLAGSISVTALVLLSTTLVTHTYILLSPRSLPRWTVCL